MITEMIAQRIFEHVADDGTYYRADAKLYRLGSNARPYFSLTGEEWQSRRHYVRRTHHETGLRCMGAMGETLVKFMPELAMVESLHLADDDGVPMHAVENGFYYYSGDAHEYERESRHHADPTDTPRARAARRLRITEAELPEGIKTKEEFVAFVDTLRPRWKEEAAQALAFLRA